MASWIQTQGVLPGIDPVPEPVYAELYFLANAGHGMAKLQLKHGYSVRLIPLEVGKSLVTHLEGVPVDRFRDITRSYQGELQLGNVLTVIERRVTVKEVDLTYAPSSSCVNEAKRVSAGYVQRLLQTMRLFKECGVRLSFSYDVMQHPDWFKVWGAGYQYSKPDGNMFSFSLNDEELKEAQMFLDTVDISTASGRLKNALEAYEASYHIPQKYLQFLMTVIGIDALFDQGPNSGGSERTSRAYCGYMFGDEESSPKIMKQVLEVYKTRNQLVHQGATEKAERKVLPTRKLLREPLKRMLLKKEEDHA